MSVDKHALAAPPRVWRRTAAGAVAAALVLVRLRQLVDVDVDVGASPPKSRERKPLQLHVVAAQVVAALVEKAERAHRARAQQQRAARRMVGDERHELRLLGHGLSRPAAVARAPLIAREVALALGLVHPHDAARAHGEDVGGERRREPQIPAALLEDDVGLHEHVRERRLQHPHPEVVGRRLEERAVARAALDLEDDGAAQILAAARRRPRAQHALRHGERAVGARVEHERELPGAERCREQRRQRALEDVGAVVDRDDDAVLGDAVAEVEGRRHGHLRKLWASAAAAATRRSRRPEEDAPRLEQVAPGLANGVCRSR